MITQEEWMDLLSYRSLAAAGASWAEIARLAGCDWRTVRKYLSGECPQPPRYRPRPPRAKLIDPYVETIDAWLRASRAQLRATTSYECPPSHPVGLIRPTDLQGSADAEDQRSEGEMPTA